jgi:hypothetical protein
MNGRTLQMDLKRRVIEQGAAAYASIGEAVERSPKTIRRWEKEGIPSRHDAFNYARNVMKKSKEESLKLALEDFPEAARTA